MIFRCSAPFFILLFSHAAISQMAMADSTGSGADSIATNFFLQALQSNKEIYNGPEHTPYLPYIEGTAYFKSKEWQMGAVQYYGMTYRNEELLYDLVKDRLVVRR